MANGLHTLEEEAGYKLNRGFFPPYPTPEHRGRLTPDQEAHLRLFPPPEMWKTTTPYLIQETMLIRKQDEATTNDFQHFIMQRADTESFGKNNMPQEEAWELPEKK